MLNEEIKPRTNSMTDDAMKAPCNKQKEREDLERATEEFLRRKGRIVELRPDPTIADTLLF